MPETDAATVARVSLRAQLGGAEDPDFELRLLPGWRRWKPDEAQRSTMMRGIDERLRAAGRPDLAAEAGALVHQSFRDMQRSSVIAAFTAMDEGDDTLWLPGSMVATIRRATPEYSLDDLVVHHIQQYGAGPLFDDKRFLRTERSLEREVPDGKIRMTSIEYMVPIPTSNRRRALCFTASLGTPVTVAADEPRIATMKLAFDAMVSTLRWVPPRAAA